MRVLGVDPHSAKPYGLAVLETSGSQGFNLLWHGEGDLFFVNNLLLDTMQLFIPAPINFVAIEDQYLNRNFKVSKALSWSAGMVAGLATIAGIRHAFVNVATWKSKTGAAGGRHVEVVRDRYEVEASDDAASAILIAEYALKYLTE